MPRASVPKMRKAVGRDLARVTLAGKTYYLGRWKSQAAKLKYDQLIAEWLASGRTLPDDDPDELLVAELCEKYVTWAKEYYQEDGKRRGVVNNLMSPLEALMDLFGDELASSFGPKRLKVLQQAWIDGGLSRSHINALTGRIKRMYKWAVSEEIVPPEVFQALAAVEGIRRGRTRARESEPVKPVSDTLIEATLPHLSRTVAAMVLVQRYTGCRPGEVCRMRADEIDRSGDVWFFRPRQHKTANKGKRRAIAIGPEAQLVVTRFWKDDGGFLFVPQRKKGPPCGPCYTNDSYRRAVQRVCQKQGLEKWSPLQIRHTAATEIRENFGIEHVQAALGHSSVKTSEIYAEHSLLRAHDVAVKLG